MSGPSIRLYVNFALKEGAVLHVPEAQAHYLANVMRLAAGDEVLVFDGVAGEYAAVLESATRKAVTLRALRQTRPPETQTEDCWLCFALLKRQKTDLVVEKATELGATVIQPVMTARTQADHVNLDRLRAIAIEAAEQCERLTIPEIRAPVKLPALLANWPANRTLYMADERRDAPGLRRPAADAPHALLIGPEGGFTSAEVAAIGSDPRVSRVSLGPRILRAETAAIAGLALLLAASPPEE